MFKSTASILVLAAAVTSGCVATAPKQYSGQGGMTAYKILPEVYLYHYEKGFTGRDAMGWDPNLQFAWSRLAAARTCSVPFSQEKAVSALIKNYGHDKLAHEMVGLDFHHLQAKGVPNFCSPERVAEVRALVPGMEAGVFPKRF
jgi:hypothetical protein